VRTPQRHSKLIAQKELNMPLTLERHDMIASKLKEILQPI
jgi:hypothetical protein